MSGLVNSNIDELEVAMLEHEPINCPLNHRFADGLYIREIFMPTGSYVTSLVHNSTHPFFILKGKVIVYSDNDGEQYLEAPYIGITTPGTRRALKIIEGTIWVTVHKTDIIPKENTKESIEEAVSLIGEQILDKYENPLLNGHFVNNVFQAENKKKISLT